MSKFTGLVLLCLLASPAWAENQPSLVSGPTVTPERAKGISVYMNSENVVRLAKQDNNEKIQRFIVAGADKKSIIASDPTAAGLIEQIQGQPAELRENGIWFVYSAPDSYTELDIKEIANLKMLSKQNEIPFYECRASELPDGWKRIN